MMKVNISFRKFAFSTFIINITLKIDYRGNMIMMLIYQYVVLVI